MGGRVGPRHVGPKVQRPAAGFLFKDRASQIEHRRDPIPILVIRNNLKDGNTKNKMHPRQSSASRANILKLSSDKTKLKTKCMNRTKACFCCSFQSAVHEECVAGRTGDNVP